MADMPIGDAVKAMLGDLTQDEIAQAIGTTQPKISELAAGKNLTRTIEALDLIRRIEQATGRPPGATLAAAGYVEYPHDVGAMIAADPYLTDDQRDVLETAWERARARTRARRSKSPTRRRREPR